MLLRAAVLAAIVVGSEAQDLFKYGAFLRTATSSVALKMGFFQDVNLNVQFLQVGSSQDAFNGLQDGTYDLLSATIDNALVLHYNQGKDIRVLGQGDQGPALCLAANPSITSISMLKGKALLVDSAASGYSALLQDILQQKAGLSLANGDYTFVTGGGSQQRYNALIAGSAIATMLPYPFPAMGEALPAGQRPNILLNVSSLPGASPITSSAYNVFSASITDSVKKPLIVRFLTAMYAGAQFLQNPDNKACAVSAIMSDLGVSQAIAQQLYLQAVDPVSGEISGPTNNFTVSSQGILNDVNIRKGIAGGFTSTPNLADLVPGAPNGLIDYSLRDAAVAAFNSNPLKGISGSCKPTISEPTTGGTFRVCNQPGWVGTCDTVTYKTHECIKFTGKAYDQNVHSFGPDSGSCTWYTDAGCQDPIIGATDVQFPGTNNAGSPAVSSVMCKNPPVSPVGSAKTFMCPLPGFEPGQNVGSNSCQLWEWNSFECHPFTNTIFFNNLGSFGPKSGQGACTIYSDTGCAHAINSLINVKFPGKADLYGAGAGEGSSAQAMMCI